MVEKNRERVAVAAEIEGGLSSLAVEVCARSRRLVEEREEEKDGR